MLPAQCVRYVTQVCGQVRRDGLDGRHPVFSLYSRETKECSLFIFIQMNFDLTESAIHCIKIFFKIRRCRFVVGFFYSLAKIQAEENQRRRNTNKLFRFNLKMSSILKSEIYNICLSYKAYLCRPSTLSSISHQLHLYPNS